MKRIESTVPARLACTSEADFLTLDDNDLDQVSGAVAPVLLYAAAAGLGWGIAAGYLSNR
ncbi:class IIb bacteriocin, lactobin A/cerein 7B family [Rhizobium wenxiniae]|uniref:class IIb bacteriocin, lactobin A/cerein 7B family n=1 Tax=Rhizobium wenxiniae TaxID=1737357 RepID=UPI001C6F0243|nr:class IIb bacteriocin, lactobin A/cerein 7B family [Rhizobium wenxiniae]MBW9089292.1 class IIb bacteriocin, lactobin A/cerein 7B family [Rhizobium wenxiniae]